eukprot:229355-Chlamydomonas_euryale.AAC.1
MLPSRSPLRTTQPPTRPVATHAVDRHQGAPAAEIGWCSRRCHRRTGGERGAAAAQPRAPLLCAHRGCVLAHPVHGPARACKAQPHRPAPLPTGREAGRRGRA